VIDNRPAFEEGDSEVLHSREEIEVSETVEKIVSVLDPPAMDKEISMNSCSNEPYFFVAMNLFEENKAYLEGSTTHNPSFETFEKHL